MHLKEEIAEILTHARKKRRFCVLSRNKCLIAATATLAVVGALLLLANEG